MQQSCILCGAEAAQFFTDEKKNSDYYHCKNCELRFLGPVHRLNPADEKKRYLLHTNNFADSNYEKFLEPILSLLKKNLPANASGLDYGCGQTPALSQFLSEEGFAMEQFDPFFFPNPAALTKSYDFLAAVEVAEHFYDPLLSFTQMRNLLKARGHLALMSSLFVEKIDFRTWYYRKDPTHVCFYHRRTFAWLQENLKFQSLLFYGDNTILLTIP